MSTPLRPLSTGELLDRTFHLYRNNFMLFAGIATIVGIAVMSATLTLTVLGISLMTPGAQFDPRTFLMEMTIVGGVFALFHLLGSSLATGATIYAVSKVNLGQPVTISECYRKVLPRFGRIILISLQILVRLIGILLLLYVCLFVIGFIIGIVFAGVGGRGPSILGLVVGLGAAITVYVILARYYLKYSLAIPPCMLENTRTTDSIRRSEFLTQDYLWRVFLIYLLMWVISFALSFVFHSPLNLIKSPYMVLLVCQLLATFLANTLSFPIGTIATCLLYYDLRVRKEAFDLQLMMESLGHTEAQAAAAPASPTV
jgi:hypothetical protein